VIQEYEDVALYIPTSLRIEHSVDAMCEMVETNIREYKSRQKAGRMQDLSQSYAPGEVVFQQGDTENQDCFFIVEGSFDVVINEKKIVTISEPGLPVGEMSFLTGEPRTATLIAAEASKLLCVQEKDKKKVLARNPTMVNTLLEALVTRLTDTSHKLVDAKVTADHALEEEATLQQALDQKIEESLALQNRFESLQKQQGPTSQEQDKMSKLAKYAAYEAGVKKGNREILNSLVTHLETNHNLDAIIKENPIFGLLKDYLSYLESQAISKAVQPVTFANQLPTTLKKILGS
jgi:CRP-like cAMP-binding protein